MAYLSEKGLLPCPFCGGPARTFQYNGTAQASCAALHTECAGTDVIAPVAMWNRRALSAVSLPDELEVLGYLFDLRYGPDHWSQQRMFSNQLPSNPEDVRNVEPLVRASQAHSTIAALRAERDEAIGKAERQWAGWVKEEVRRKEVEAEAKRLTEENEALSKALEGCWCPRPANNRPDHFTVGECVAAGECGCCDGAPLIPRQALSGSKE